MERNIWRLLSPKNRLAAPATVTSDDCFCHSPMRNAPLLELISHRRECRL